jgi:hypothetical protein
VTQLPREKEKTNHDVGRVVVKDSRDVFTREGVGSVGNQQAGFTDGTITDDDTFDVLHCTERKKQRSY